MINKLIWLIKWTGKLDRVKGWEKEIKKREQKTEKIKDY